jgi:serine/threonine-protein kinase
VSLLAELKRRKVFKVGAAYLVVGWLLIQVAATVGPQLSLPEWAPRLITFVIMLGFPIAVVMAWVFDVTPEGIRIDTPRTGSKRVFTVASVLAALALGWFLYGQRTSTRAETVAPLVVGQNSIAVMPFADMSEAGDQAYFSDGMSEELLNLLAQVPGLHVAGRTSTLSFKGKNATVAEIGKTLNVGTLLEGSVRKTGDRLRITVQLINVADGYQLWSETYDRKQDDVFAVQDDIAGAVIDALRLKLLPGAKPSNRKHHVPNFEAYTQFLIGRQAMVRSEAGSPQIALAAFRRAVVLDPEYADAFSGLAMAESFVNEENSDPALSTAGDRRATAAAERAVALDPNLGDAYASRGYLRSTVNWDWDGAMADLLKAISLNPGDARNQLRYGYLLATMGRLPEAEAAFEVGKKQDPLFTPVWYLSGRVKAAQADYKGATAAMRRVLEIDPQFRAASYYLGTLDLLRGDPASARAAFAKLRSPYGLAMAEHDLGHPTESKKALEQLIAEHPTDSTYSIATVYAWTGDKDHAFAWLDRAIEHRDIGVVYLKYDPLLRGLRDDPRYLALLEKLGLPK